VPLDTIAAARRLARRSPKTGKRLPLRVIAAKLAEQGHLGPSGKQYFAASVSKMLDA
jgi:hypothetical protein